MIARKVQAWLTSLASVSGRDKVSRDAEMTGACPAPGSGRHVQVNVFITRPRWIKDEQILDRVQGHHRDGFQLAGFLHLRAGGLARQLMAAAVAHDRWEFAAALAVV